MGHMRTHMGHIRTHYIRSVQECTYPSAIQSTYDACITYTFHTGTQIPKIKNKSADKQHILYTFYAERIHAERICRTYIRCRTYM